MNVETYEAISLDVQDGDAFQEAVNAEAMALIETLGLQGQRELLQESNVGGESVTTRNPYRRMTKEEQAIFTAIMPERTKLAQYRDGPIPLRALQVAAHAVDLFSSVEVWHPEAGKDDPVLVGVNTPNGEYGVRELFLLARWGEELCSLDDLRAKAVPLLMAKAKRSIADAKAALHRFESGLADNVDAYLRDGNTPHEFVSLTFAR